MSAEEQLQPNEKTPPPQQELASDQPPELHGVLRYWLECVNIKAKGELPDPFAREKPSIF